jgi:hypothetical protein
MRTSFVLLVLLLLGLGQGLLVHTHEAHTHSEVALDDSRHTHVHSHVIDSEALDLDHLQAIDEAQTDAPFRPSTMLFMGTLAAIVWTVFAVVFSPRSGFLIRTPPPRPAMRARPPICLRPAPQGPPC